jgi:hypothetical protein
MGRQDNVVNAHTHIASIKNQDCVIIVTISSKVAINVVLDTAIHAYPASTILILPFHRTDKLAYHAANNGVTAYHAVMEW